MRVLLMLLVAGCVTDPDEDLGPVSKVTYKEVLVTAGQPSLPSPCWDVVIGKPHDCSVLMLSDAGVAAIMPSCAFFPDARPCWTIAVDTQRCMGAAHQMLEIVRSEPPRYTHHLVATCASL